MTANELIKAASADLGYMESPKNSNKTKFGKWFGLDGEPWGMQAVQYWCSKAGEALPYKTASCSGLLNWYKKNKPESVFNTPEPGDIVIYNFGHTGIVEAVSGNSITAIEGNTSADDKGSQDNGGGVYRRKRSKSLASGYIRVCMEEEEMTYEKFKEYMNQYVDEISKLPPAEWSKDARIWAEGKGYLNGDIKGDRQYKKYSTREELVQILYNILGNK
jgi:hypothetical protein